MKKITLIVGLFASLLLITGCGNNNTDTNTQIPVGNNQGAVVENADTVEVGDLVGINYIGTTDEGVFDTNLPDAAEAAGIFNPERPYEPLEFIVGDGKVIPGMESGVTGMKLNETKTFTIPSFDAYGERSEDRLQDYPLSQFAEEGIEPELGDTYVIGGVLPGYVYAINEDTVTLDFNSPLAGMDLTFEVTILEITKNAMDQGDTTNPVVDMQ